jgi:sulfonate transport system permease protein
VSSRPSRIPAPPPWARWVSPILLLVLWQVASSTGLLPDTTIGSPEDIATAAWDLIKDGQLSDALVVSLRRVALGVLFGVALAIVFGLAAGLSQWGDVLLDPPMQMARTIPLYGVVPLFIVWFGIGESTKVILIALGVMVPLYINLTAALRGIDPELREVADTLRLTRWERLRHLIFPAALPGALVGLRLSLAVAWLVLIVSETINADSGIGFIVNNARTFLQNDVIVVGLLTYAVLGLLTDFVVRLMERWALRWQVGVAR